MSSASEGHGDPSLSRQPHQSRGFGPSIDALTFQLAPPARPPERPQSFPLLRLQCGPHCRSRGQRQRPASPRHQPQLDPALSRRGGRMRCKHATQQQRFHVSPRPRRHPAARAQEAVWAGPTESAGSANRPGKPTAQRRRERPNSSQRSGRQAPRAFASQALSAWPTPAVHRHEATKAESLGDQTNVPARPIDLQSLDSQLLPGKGAWSGRILSDQARPGQGLERRSGNRTEPAPCRMAAIPRASEPANPQHGSAGRN
jgi:hypothetical protein